MSVSVIIIARNEEKNIEKCIKTVGFAEEIIVIDNESKDKTADIAKKLKVKIIKVSGLDFSYLRNIGKEKAKCDWLLYLDADERVTDSLANEIVDAATFHKGRYSAFKIIRKNYYFNTLWSKEEKFVRLINKKFLIGWQGILHENPIIAGEIGELKFPLLHHTHSDLTLMVEKTNEWSNIEAQLLYRNNHPKITWWRLFRVMFTSFIKSYFTDGGYKVGTPGLIESIYQAFSSFITYSKLWENQNINFSKLNKK